MFSRCSLQDAVIILGQGVSRWDTSVHHRVSYKKKHGTKASRQGWKGDQCHLLLLPAAEGSNVVVSERTADIKQ